MTRRAATRCTCAPGAEGHQVTCPVAKQAIQAMGGRLRQAGARGPVDGLGRKSRHQSAVATERRGLRFPSRLEADLFDLLWERRSKVPGAELLVQPRFQLWRSWAPGMGRPLTFTPDFLLVLPRHVVSAMEPEEVSDDVRAREGFVWAERPLDLFVVQVHEAKTSRGQESPDYVRGLAAWRAEHPGWPFFVWRRPAGRREGLDQERLGDLQGATVPGNDMDRGGQASPPAASRPVDQGARRDPLPNEGRS